MKKKKKNYKNKLKKSETENKFKKIIKFVIGNILNRTDEGLEPSVFFAELICMLFNFIAIVLLCSGIGFIGLFVSMIVDKPEQITIFLFISYIFLIILSFIYSFIFRCFANAINREKDKSYIIGVFSALTSLISLIISFVALNK